MAVFRWRHFAGEIILWAVRWYCRYGISYRELEEMMGERGVAVDHTTVYRWTQRYAPELEKRSAWYRSRLSFSWRVDETYVRVKGRWKYLYRAIDKEGATLDFYLADRRNAQAAKHGCEHWWFEDRGPQCTLLVFIDDATGRLMHLQFVESESTFAYFAAARAYLEAWGKPVAFYSDKHGVFRVNQRGALGGDGMT